MTFVTIELPNNLIMTFDELLNKDMEVNLYEQKSYWKRKQLLGKFVIPKNRRELVAQYLLNI